MAIILKNILRSDAYKYLLIEKTADEVVDVCRYVPHYIRRHFPELVSVDVKPVFVEIYFPYMGAAQIRMSQAWKEFFVVHRLYGTGIRDCVRLGMAAWAHVKRTPEHAFVRRLPGGVENGVEAHGVPLFQAEWMMLDAVAVG